jgi:uncharacterized membrane protein
MYVLTLILLHLVGFAAFLGGGFAQHQLMKSSRVANLSPAARDERESLAATICTKVELPALFAQLATGILLVVSEPGYLKQHWLHGKLTAVLVLLVLAHLDMVNVRKIVELRRAGRGGEAEITALKARHALVGTVSGILLLAVLLFVTVLRPYL